MEVLKHPLYHRFPPSESCSCRICRSFCQRPGWPLVEEARLAMQEGLADRMMLEFSPDFSFGILAPAFKGNEGSFALQILAAHSCTFLGESGCTIFNFPYRPLECRFCHHSRMGEGLVCHLSIAKDWNTSKGKRLVKRWLQVMGLEYPLPLR
ncbi:MAG: hypothetical protein AB7C91_09610 [Sphaerochaeta sp.]|uniref:hypothetical protein n=1 Tax=Sphaerochaeta sp. TaxID=1972642 RepID=UPI002FC5902A